MSNINEKIERVLFSEEQIKNRIAEVGKRISRDYEGKDPLIVGILKGSFVFMADLIRAIDIPCRTAFMKASSYGMNTVSSGTVKVDDDIEKALGTPVRGQHILIVEDILDTALTLSTVCEKIKLLAPASLKVCTFMDKQVERTIDFKADYKCFDVENEFVVGYGVDYAEHYRNLPYIGVLKS